MVPRNLILQRSDDIEDKTKPKRGEGSLHPRPKGQGIRDPPHSRSNKTNFYAHLPKAGDEFLNNCLPEFKVNITHYPIVTSNAFLRQLAIMYIFLRFQMPLGITYLIP